MISNKSEIEEIQLKPNIKVVPFVISIIAGLVIIVI
ncbi:hypothetical protein CLMAG_06760 [Clostridium magnum DSM 2767]|uniref:Uncharacterized protein n=1 Tax=Clostridium magnum DSM 2767 TaxID=1121326 RepID=A0A162U7X6_9CLOT|nr:hypothetical protein CLMAG_06760 [Clostridium magnum DSM 2767]